MHYLALSDDVFQNNNNNNNSKPYYYVLLVVVLGEQFRCCVLDIVAQLIDSVFRSLLLCINQTCCAFIRHDKPPTLS
jgi:hypothetical protein